MFVIHVKGNLSHVCVVYLYVGDLTKRAEHTHNPTCFNLNKYHYTMKTKICCIVWFGIPTLYLDEKSCYHHHTHTHTKRGEIHCISRTKFVRFLTYTKWYSVAFLLCFSTKNHAVIKPPPPPPPHTHKRRNLMYFEH